MTGPADSSACPDADWWLEDPELWPLLAFVGTTDADGLPVDPTWKDRQQVLEDLIRRPGPINLDFARYLLVQETHSHGHSWGFRHGIEIAAILVAEHRQVQDVWLLWDAVYRSFDTWGVMPHQFLFAAGVEATRQYVANSDHPQRDLLAEDLRKLADATDEHVEHLIAARRFYYTEALAELDEPATVTPGSAANDTTGRPAVMTEPPHEDPAHPVLRTLHRGQIVTGTVIEIASFGVTFVDIGGLTAMINIPELSWRPINHPSDIVTVGKEVTAEILDVDPERRRVALSLKALQNDPLVQLQQRIGKTFTGPVTKLVPFGAFVRVEDRTDSFEGLVHSAELADIPLQVGYTLTVKIARIDTMRRRIELNLTR